MLAEADELRVLQLGRILVENALLHTPPGTPVEVRTLERDGNAVLEVEDAGGGIREDQRAQLFERFFRLDGTRASGSGLGLAIARQLAELMDGSIELDSRPGRTVFSLVLPRAAAALRAVFTRKGPFGRGVATVRRLCELPAVALVCALLGGLAALGLGKLTGWTDSSSTTTVFRAAPATGPSGEAATAAVAPNVKPLTGNGFSPSAIYASRAAGVVTIVSVFGTDPETATQAQGSGFVVSPKGFILTNSHVITDAGSGSVAKPADKVYVEFQDKDRAEASIVGWDVFDDVGLIKVDPSAHTLVPVPLGNSAAVAVGAPVAAIGSPFGNEDSLGVGVVSATHRSIDSLTSDFKLVDAIQTDAPINHGNSGGPLFDARGRVIGINAQIRSQSGQAEGVGFAVPINSAKRSMDQLIADGSVSYAYVGVATTDLTPALARHFGYPVTHGAVVTGIVPGSPAAKAGLHADSSRAQAFGVVFPRNGDVIVAIDGQRVVGSQDIARIVTNMSPGQVTRFAIERGHSRLDLPLRLGERSETH